MGNQTDHDTNIRTFIEILEDEVLELERQERDLLVQLSLLRDSIIHKKTLAGNLKNSLIPVNRLPNEILVACFGQAVQDWVDEGDGSDEWEVAYHDVLLEGPCLTLPCIPVLAISHVSHHWRQLTINTPSLWTSLAITPSFEHHLNIFRDFLRRANGLPIAANFRCFAPAITLSPAGVSLVEAVMSLLHAQQIRALTFLASSPVLSFLLSQIVDEPVIGPLSPPSILFSSLTSLTIFELNNPERLAHSHLRRLLSATPQLKTLALQLWYNQHSDVWFNAEAICLPLLESLTIIDSTALAYQFLNSLSAPGVHQLKLLIWDEWHDFVITSCLFLGDSDSFGSRVPRFPRVQNLTLSCSDKYYHLHPDLIHAFPRATHLTLRSASLFYEAEASESRLALPTFRWLQHLTLDFAFEDADGMDPQCCFTWLPKPKDQVDHRLPIRLCIKWQIGIRSGITKSCSNMES
ncbi:hypothetical protein BJ138DRAFT_1211565 [Hygrophoropsis aurantiaca]|uniref:Uncharacterized protein n=1 Tax=Hygrophoropsis aurantiaca TaxID=72124 RepID=A0ACB8A2I2_9AGAM|nr:hypothetical protein BJ138DRAFT_1211565 [Hygrophoropsis aurantiaca]